MSDHKYEPIRKAYEEVLEEACNVIGINAHQMKFKGFTDDPSIINRELYKTYHKGVEYSKITDKHEKVLLNDFEQEARKKFFAYEKKPLSGYTDEDNVSKATAEDIINDIHTVFLKGAIDGLHAIVTNDLAKYQKNIYNERKYLE